MGNILRKQTELYKTLTDEVVAHCRQISGLTDGEIRHEHARFFDLAEDGRLKKIYMEELLGDHIPAGKWKRMKYLIDCLFSAIDTNNDGYIDFLEYLMSVKFFQTESSAEKADFIFRIMDKNGDKMISGKDIQRLLECLEEYHRKSSNAHVLDAMSHGTKSATNAIVEKLDHKKSGLIGADDFTSGWLKDESIRALFTF